MIGISGSCHTPEDDYEWWIDYDLECSGLLSKGSPL
jgi:hypothetical protein